MPENDKKENPKLQSKNVTSLRDLPLNVTSLRDLPLELRKKEASKPMYLTRYE